MLLSYKELKEIVEMGYITNVTDDLINGTSIDVTLGKHLLLERGAAAEYRGEQGLYH